MLLVCAAEALHKGNLRRQECIWELFDFGSDETAGAEEAKRWQLRQAT